MLASFYGKSQVVRHVEEQEDIQLPENLTNRSFHIGDTVFIFIGNCKSNGLALFQHVKYQPGQIIIAKEEKAPFLKVHGNILYNFSYRSYIDTPFAQNDLQQHLVQTSLNFLIKDKYPVRMVITNRSSNSPYFKNTTDVNLQFNRRQLLDNIKADLRKRAETLVHTDALSKAENIYKERQQYAQQLQAWINSPARMQELVEEKEKALRQKVPALPNPATNLSLDQLNIKGLPSFNSKENKALLGKITNKVEDSLAQIAQKNKPAIKDSSLLEKFNKKKNELAKLQQELKKYNADAKKLKKAVTDSINTIKREINSLNSTAGLYDFMKKHDISKNELTKAQRVLLSINQIGIGRSWVDYSELTVKNISLTGINIEANPLPFYVAFAAGKVNYRFRDFILKDSKTLPDQSLYLIRAGVGQKEKNNFILTFYNGKKAVLNYTASNDAASVQRVLGISAEGRFAINENNYIIAEVAKSSYAGAGAQLSQSELIGKAFNLKVRTNEAYSIKVFSQYPQTDTKVNGYYRKTGENFQSFNLSPINVKQDAWMLRATQNFWKKRLMIDASIRKNDFNSPIAAPSFSTKTIFKSLQASLRIPKYPFVSVGYYPSSQLSLTNNNLLVENQYNTLNAVLNHSYQFRKIGMNTNAMFTKFYNNSSDTGFIYYNASSWTINHSIFLSPFMLQSSASITDQKDLHLFTLEQLLSYQFKNIITLTGSLKWNRLNKEETLIGGSAAMSVLIKRIGTLQFNYDKTFLPAYNRVLRPVDIGRMTFYREF